MHPMLVTGFSDSTSSTVIILSLMLEGRGSDSLCHFIRKEMMFRDLLIRTKTSTLASERCLSKLNRSQTLSTRKSVATCSFSSHLPSFSASLAHAASSSAASALPSPTLNPSGTKSRTTTSILITLSYSPLSRKKF